MSHFLTRPPAFLLRLMWASLTCCPCLGQESRRQRVCMSCRGCWLEGTGRCRGRTGHLTRRAVSRGGMGRPLSPRSGALEGVFRHGSSQGCTASTSLRGNSRQGRLLGFSVEQTNAVLCSFKMPTSSKDKGSGRSCSRSETGGPDVHVAPGLSPQLGEKCSHSFWRMTVSQYGQLGKSRITENFLSCDKTLCFWEKYQKVMGLHGFNMQRDSACRRCPSSPCPPV